MNTIRKKLVGFLLIGILALTPEVSAQAAYTDILEYENPNQASYAGVLGYEQNLKNGFHETVVYSADTAGYYEANVNGIYGLTCKNQKAVSADKKVVTATYSSAHQSFLLFPKKPGTAEVTFSAIRKGKKVTCKGTVKVVKFKNPVKSLTINGKNYAKKIHTANAVIPIQLNQTNVSFGYELKPGWKVERAYGEITGKSLPLGIYEPVKNHQMYSLKKGDLQIRMTLKNSKRGETAGICLSVKAKKR